MTRPRAALRGGIGLVTMCLASAALVLGAVPASAASLHGQRAKLTPPAIHQAGHLQFCSTIDTPPVEYYTLKHVPTGSDIALGNAIAHRLGLTPQWANVTFSDIIPDLEAGHCDLIMSDLYIKPTRLKVVNMIPYMSAGEWVVVKKGNPNHITGMNSSLCGTRVATNFSTTAEEYTTKTSKACTKAGKKGITIQQFKTTIEALQQLALGRATSFATTVSNAAYYMAKRKGLFQSAGKPYGQILCGIAMLKGNPSLEKGVTRALRQVFSSGQYARIMDHFGLAAQKLAKPLPPRH